MEFYLFSMPNLNVWVYIDIDKATWKLGSDVSFDIPTNYPHIQEKYHNEISYFETCLKENISKHLLGELTMCKNN